MLQNCRFSFISSYYILAFVMLKQIHKKFLFGFDVQED